jgi:phosphoglycerate dehydrogenase-like enzyme
MNRTTIARVKIAILDDYQRVALSMADWSVLEGKAEITVFSDHLADESAVIERLKSFDIVCVMRERTPLTGSVLRSLPELKLIVSTGMRNASIDLKAAEERGIVVAHTGYLTTGAPELTWALLMAIARRVVPENAAVLSGGWQSGVGTDLSGKTIGIVGLGRIGSKIAQYARAFDMPVIAWSENLTPEKAESCGAEWVPKEELFRRADFVTVHLVLSPRSRGIIGARELALMKPSAYFINTSRGPLADEPALIRMLEDRKIAGAALDVFDTEPLGADHPFRTLDNVLTTPHIGYVTHDTYKLFYEDTVRAIVQFFQQFAPIGPA